MAIGDTNTKGIVIMQQANPFERFLEGGQGYTRSGYEGYVNALRTGAVAFGKPVLMVGGDTHTIRIDKPLTNLYPGHCTLGGLFTATNCVLQAGTTNRIVVAGTGTRLQNFTRVEVFGSPDTHWVRVIVDPFDPNLFSFAMQTIAGNGHGRDGRTDDDDLQ
jgi:hypothetical protein